MGDKQFKISLDMLSNFDKMELPQKYVPYEKDSLQYFKLISKNYEDLDNMINNYLTDECLSDANNFKKYDMLEFRNEIFKKYMGFDLIIHSIARSYIENKENLN